MLHSFAGQSLAAWKYTYDPVTGYLMGDGEDTYHYDLLGRLTQATVKRLNNNGTVVQSFDYDPFGNQILSQTSGDAPPPGTPGFNINNFNFTAREQAALAGSNQLPATSGGALTGALYDPQGNLTQFWPLGNSSAMLSFVYDALGRVTQMTDDGRNVTETYAYTTEGLRTFTQVFQNLVLQKGIFNVYNDLRQLVSVYEFVQE